MLRVNNTKNAVSQAMRTFLKSLHAFFTREKIKRRVDRLAADQASRLDNLEASIQSIDKHLQQHSTNWSAQDTNWRAQEASMSRVREHLNDLSEHAVILEESVLQAARERHYEEFLATLPQVEKRVPGLTGVSFSPKFGEKYKNSF